MEIKAEYYTFTAYVEQVGETQVLGGNGFRKREIIVDKRMDKYPQPIKFTFKKDNCARLEDVKKNDIVKISFYPDGRAWNGPKGVVYFVDLVGYKCEVIEKAQGNTPEAPQPAEPPQSMQESASDDCEDLPF